MEYFRRWARTIHGAFQQRTVHDTFHIIGAGWFQKSQFLPIEKDLTAVDKVLLEILA